MFHRVALLLFGIFCAATAVIFIKASHEQPFLVAAYRLLIAALVLSPFFWRELRREHGRYGWRQLGWSAAPAVALAVHFMSWVVGARMTRTTNASVIINLTPVAMPFFLWAVYREKINRREVYGTFVTLVGLLILASANFRVAPAQFLGDVICLGSMLAYASYLALGRKNAGRLNLWLYTVPMYFIAGVICLVCALRFTNPIRPYAAQELLYILGLGLIPTVIGHSLLNYSFKFFRGQVVSLTNLTQPLFAGVLGYLLLGDVPNPVIYWAAAFIIGGVMITLLAHPASQRVVRPPKPESLSEQSPPA